MKYYGKAEETANAILKAFETPQALPAALAPIFIKSNANQPARAWSFSNQLAIALAGHSDARGFRQWQEVGRQVKKGEKACHILIPLIGKKEENGEQKSFIYGFKSAPVFGYAQTEGDELPKEDAETDQWLESLPLRSVADQWGLSVAHYNGHQGGALGYYRHGQAIAMGVKNLSTWCHELVHAADDRRGTIRRVPGQDLSNEVVAEFGGAILLSILGQPIDADLGGCYEYLQAYAGKENQKVLNVCTKFLKRTCEAVQLIIETAEALQPAETIETLAAA